MSDELQFDSDELAELRGIFFEQATEVLDSLGELLVKVESDPTDTEALRSIRRAVHTLKGDSTAFGFSELTELAHHYEDALDRLRSREEQAASRALVDLLLAGADALTALVNYYRGECPMPDTEQLIAGLAALHETEHAPATTEGTSQGDGDHQPAPALKGEMEAMGPAQAGATAEAETEEIVGISEGAGQFDERRGGVDRRQSGDRRQPQALTLRVESERIDAAMNLVGELIIQRSMIATISAEMDQERSGDELVRRLQEALALTGRSLSELQESVMRMRLVAIDQVFKRFPRVVRDSGVKLGKPLRLEVSGGNTEIDKSIVELISDPLIHLVRNACDHGVEAPEARRAAGKPEEGVIRLNARRVGNQIAVEVEDDGGGIDAERIAAKAIQKGLISAQEAADWNEQQKINLIFLAGFSTREAVSDMSGRGVGMDVVKSSVDTLGGSVTISSIPGQGSRFTIKLPLTMAIVRAMIFETAGRKYALPLDTIREITRLKPGRQQTVDGSEVLRLRDKVLSLVRVDLALGLSTRTEIAARPDQRPFVFVVDLGEGRDVGLVVERLYGEQELVLKSVDDTLTKSTLVTGASILGDGSVVLILDAQEVVSQSANCQVPEQLVGAREGRG